MVWYKQRILRGFGCRVIAYDLLQNPECEKLGISYVSLEELLAQSDIISLHCPLMDETRHIINSDSIAIMKEGVMLINTARGELIDTKALIGGLKCGKVGSAGIDVYEREKGVFFEDKSAGGIEDGELKELIGCPNVIITGHQASFTSEAKRSIAETILNTLDLYEKGQAVNRALFL